MEKSDTNGALVINSIINNYQELEKSLASQLNFKVPCHPPTVGGFREEVWEQFLMLINNLMPFPHIFYVKMFNNVDKE